MATRLFVGNLSYRMSEQELKEVFEEGGRSVVEVKIVTDRETGRSRGFAFVEMGSDSEATAAIEALGGREVAGRPINVSEARARTPRPPGGGGGDRGWGGGGPDAGYGGGDRAGRGRELGYEGRGRRGGW